MASKQYNGFKQIEQQYGGESFTTDIDIDSGTILFQTSPNITSYTFDKPINGQLAGSVNNSIEKTFSMTMSVNSPGAAGEIPIYMGTNYERAHQFPIDSFAASLIDPSKYAIYLTDFAIIGNSGRADAYIECSLELVYDKAFPQNSQYRHLLTAVSTNGLTPVNPSALIQKVNGATGAILVTLNLWNTSSLGTPTSHEKSYTIVGRLGATKILE